MSNVKNKMSNVNKVKLLSERTSGVPPVIFFLGKCERLGRNQHPVKKIETQRIFGQISNFSYCKFWHFYNLCSPKICKSTYFHVPVSEK